MDRNQADGMGPEDHGYLLFAVRFGPNRQLRVSGRLEVTTKWLRFSSVSTLLLIGLILTLASTH